MHKHVESEIEDKGIVGVIFSGVLNLSCLVNKEWTMYCCEQ